ncbi:MAG: hypothetical protein HKN21_14965 [Candidatus Eisenbacteria bacterium]|uniref:Uncharacterized protein n=1 Tax=Eiseniibacteriota bacterium TaxID=2212470 RepID=A0A7Y2H3Q0_UNCEI|nr:hypothetical protein [Candidatus Eisenbacteria bacterium]
MDRKRLFVYLALVSIGVSLSMGLTGCAKLISSNEDDFSAAKKMVVTFRDGEQLKGRFAEGEDVTFVTFGRVYRATIEDMGPPNIVLTNAYVQEEYDKFEMQRERMEDSVLKKRDETTQIVIPRYKIRSVEEVTFDQVKTAKLAVFWGFTTFILSSILGARL